MPPQEMTAAEYRERIEPRNEQVFTDMVLQELRSHGWMAYHTHDSRRSEPGYPDIHAIHRERRQSFFAELKMPKGRISPAQVRWIAGLVECGHPVFVWRPEHWGEIRDIASGAIDL